MGVDGAIAKEEMRNSIPKIKKRRDRSTDFVFGSI